MLTRGTSILTSNKRHRWWELKTRTKLAPLARYFQVSATAFWGGEGNACAYLHRPYPKNVRLGHRARVTQMPRKELWKWQWYQHVTGEEPSGFQGDSQDDGEKVKINLTAVSNLNKFNMRLSIDSTGIDRPREHRAPRWSPPASPRFSNVSYFILFQAHRHLQRRKLDFRWKIWSIY